MIRLLDTLDGEALLELRLHALLDAPLSFGSSPETDFMAEHEALEAYFAARPEKLLWGAFDERDQLVGMLGLVRGRSTKRCHRAGIWGMYVAPEARGLGLGAGLLAAATEAAREAGLEYLDLSVSSAAPAALRLYERAGFVHWGTESDALRDAGQASDELHMVLALASS